MRGKLFDAEISPCCAYCEFGVPVSDGAEILCPNRGVMQADSACKKFRYDPLRRKPRRAKPQSGFTAEDFQL